MLSEQLNREAHEEHLSISGLPHDILAPERPADEGLRGLQLDGRQQADHFTATFGCLAMMQMGREG